MRVNVAVPQPLLVGITLAQLRQAWPTAPFTHAQAMFPSQPFCATLATSGHGESCISVDRAVCMLTACRRDARDRS